MMYSMPLYEAKYKEEEEWVEITDVEMMDGLYRIYNKVTPAIKEMIQGKEIRTPEAVYRLKFVGGDPSDLPAA